VYPDNGCLSYIPKSNIITYVLREAIYKKEIPYSPYWSLKDLRDQFKSENNVKFLNKKITKEDLDIFMKHSSDALNKSIKTNKFDFSLKKGGAIIFDESGVHRGSSTKFSDRLVLRYFYKKV
tara:strand:- start:329 stop:694 length:366 start_codon:yes stop_codon:yes gene_type:complete